MRYRWLAALVVAGCDGSAHQTDVEATLRFAAQDENGIARLAMAAIGGEAFAMRRDLLEYFEHPVTPDPCPAISVDEASRTVAIVGGCRRADGVSVTGSVVVSNPTQWGALVGDPGRAERYDAAMLAIEQYGFVQAFHGYVEIGPGGEYVDIDLTVEKLGAALRADAYLACDGLNCQLDGGVELAHHGGAHATGSTVWSRQPASVALVLQGADRLELEVGGGCTQWSIEASGDADRMYKSCP